MPELEPIPAYASSIELKKHAAIVHTSGQLSLLERKLVNVLLLNAYNDLPTSQTHAIPVKFLSAMVGWDESHDFAHLKKALKRIVGTPLELNVLGNAGKARWSATSLLSSAEIENGVCTYEYSRRMAELLYAPEMYAVINIAVQKEFRGGYALTLYENCVRFKKLGKTPEFEIGRLRKLLGADAPMYDDFKRFSSFVIKKGVTEINRIADIHITPRYIRVNRKVTAIEFVITESAQQSLPLPSEIFDGSEDLKKLPIYEQLRGHGIGEILALQWLKQEPEQVRAVLEHVEAKDKKIKSKGGYIVKAMEQKYELGTTPFDTVEADQQSELASATQEEARKQRLLEYRQDYERITIASELKNLTIDRKRVLAARYVAEVGEAKTGSFDPVKVEFANKIESSYFSIWLRKAVAQEWNEAAFTQWLKAQKGVDITVTTSK